MRNGVLSSEANPPMRILANACLAAFLSTNLSRKAPTPAPARIQVMVLGTYHFDNPGQDLHNMKVDSVLTPAKQAELADVASRLAKFNPTKIAVEALSDRPDFVSNKFDGFTPDKLMYKIRTNAPRSHFVSLINSGRNPSMASMSKATRLIIFHSTKSMPTPRRTQQSARPAGCRKRSRE